MPCPSTPIITACCSLSSLGATWHCPKPLPPITHYSVAAWYSQYIPHLPPAACCISYCWCPPNTLPGLWGITAVLPLTCQSIWPWPCQYCLMPFYLSLLTAYCLLLHSYTTCWYNLPFLTPSVSHIFPHSHIFSHIPSDFLPLIIQSWILDHHSCCSLFSILMSDQYTLCTDISHWHESSPLMNIIASHKYHPSPPSYTDPIYLLLLCFLGPPSLHCTSLTISFISHAFWLFYPVSLLLTLTHSYSPCQLEHICHYLDIIPWCLPSFFTIIATHLSRAICTCCILNTGYWSCTLRSCRLLISYISRHHPSIWHPININLLPSDFHPWLLACHQITLLYPVPLYVSSDLLSWLLLTTACWLLLADYCCLNHYNAWNLNCPEYIYFYNSHWWMLLTWYNKSPLPLLQSLNIYWCHYWYLQ